MHRRNGLRRRRSKAQFKSLFPELLQQRHGGLEAVREWLQGWEAQAQEEDWLDWLERAGEVWLANPPEARFVGAMLELRYILNSL